MTDDMTRTASLLQAIAAGVDKVLRSQVKEPMGFSIVVWPRTRDERCNYVSNCARADVEKMLAELLEAWKVSPEEVPGSHRLN